MWDGQMNRDYCLDLRRIPFCTDQQVLRGEYDHVLLRSHGASVDLKTTVRFKFLDI